MLGIDNGNLTRRCTCQVPINHDDVLKVMKRFVDVGNTNRALSLFTVIENIDIDVQRIRGFIAKILLLLITLGILGGITFMVKSAFWGW